MKMISHFDSLEENWRSKYVFMLDNAAYHRSGLVSEFFRHQRLQLMFLGPYQFKLATVENFFSCIKNRDLNDLKSSIKNR